MLNHLHEKPERLPRVVILGGTGFVGSAIERVLQSQKVPIVSLGRKDLDLLSPEAGGRLQGILQPTDSVIMISAVAPAKTVSMVMQNLRMAEVVGDALVHREIAHLVYISSDAVYADSANPVNEDSACAPSTLHGLMHSARELLLKGSTKAPFVTLRPTLIYGAGDPHNGYGPNRFWRQAVHGGPVSIFGEGEEQRDHIHVEDVATLASLVLAHRSTGALNLVTGASITFHEIARMIASRFNVRVESQPRHGPRPHLLHRFFDVTNRLKAFPTFRPLTLAKGLEQMSRIS